ncbi:hypothetical protein AJ80_06031 [Polytolypa hystricis UAMH7299]|uniref:DNA polymerase epsilon subunit D n=1 Tax=Polytolypa hystricis (strain UAMH7299) TaxID=1447883 RepID=A0A2B7XZW5_POLH7|nr:hypothetical protein AJ80_06031 [Polytolypa hystricis UAMH7299]
MAPRKSTSSTGEVGNEDESIIQLEGNTPSSKNKGESAAADSGLSVEDFLLPRSLVQRLAKGVLPPNTSISKDALLAITKAASVFVSYLSSHANEETEKKTVTPQDVLAALSEIEFDAFRPRLERELAVYAEAAAAKRRGKKDNKKDAGKSVAADKDEEEGAENADAHESKRVKRDGESEIAMGRPRPGSAAANGTGLAEAKNSSARTDPADEPDDPEDEEMEEQDEVEGEDAEDDDVEEEEEEEEDDEASPQDELLEEDNLSDTARRRGGHPDFESGSESDSDGL